jgi:hypothetical protein
MSHDADAWRELRARADRSHPRYDRSYGTCNVCDAGATEVNYWGTVPWATCVCGTRWPIDPTRFERSPVEEDFDEDTPDQDDLEAAYESLMATVCEDLARHVPNELFRIERISEMKTAPAPLPPTIDPYAFTDNHRLLGRMIREHRGRLFAAVIAFMISKPCRQLGSAIGIPLGLWEAVRGLPLDDEGVTVEQALRAAGITSYISTLDELGRIALTLSDQRQRAVEQIAMIDQLGVLPNFRAMAIPPARPRIQGPAVWEYDAIAAARLRE